MKALSNVKKETVKKALGIFVLAVITTALYEYLLTVIPDWATPVYVIIACAAFGAYTVIMRGLYTHPDKVEFSHDIPEDERKVLEEKHKEHYFKARPLLYIVVCVIIAFLCDVVIKLFCQYVLHIDAVSFLSSFK